MFILTSAVDISNVTCWVVVVKKKDLFFCIGCEPIEPPKVFQTGSVQDMFLACAYKHHLVVDNGYPIVTVYGIFAHIKAELTVILTQVMVVA